MKTIWITWENQRRNKGISTALRWKLHEIVYDDKPILYRYFMSFIQTIYIIFMEKPQIVAVQNPSIFLAILAIILKWIFSSKIIIDAHNRGLYPLEGKSCVLMSISRWIQKNADLTFVTNEQLKSVVIRNGGKAYVLPDKIPDTPPVRKIHLAGKVNIAYICTFSDDEPYFEVLKAVSMLSLDICVYITGNYKGKIDIYSAPKNARLLGFIPEQEYWSLLSSANIIMDLTTREGCLVCGAYEAIALSKPLILSDTKALKSYFNKGCIYVTSTPDSIAQGIEKAIETSAKMAKDIEELNQSLKMDWNNRLINLRDIILKLAC